MKLIIVLALVALAVARPDDSHYDSKYDDFNVSEVIENDRLLKSYTHCFIGDGKCTAEGKDFKKWIPEAATSSCGKCTDKQKVMVAKTITAIKKKLPEEFSVLYKQIDPEDKHTADLDKFLAKYAA